MLNNIQKKIPNTKNPESIKAYKNTLESIFINYLKNIDNKSIEDVVDEYTSSNPGIMFLAGIRTEPYNSKIGSNTFSSLIKGFKKFYTETGIELPKSLPFDKTKEISKCFYTKDVDSSIFTRFDPSLKKIKSLYLNEDNFNYLRFSKDKNEILALTYSSIKKTIISHFMKKASINPEDKIENIRRINLIRNTENSIAIRIHYIKNKSKFSVLLEIPFESSLPSRFLNKTFDKVKAHEAGICKDIHSSYLQSLEDVWKELKIIDGNLIPFLYHESRYTSESKGMLHNSCMRTSTSVSLYSIFKDVVKMLVLFDTTGKVKGRALIWKGISKKYFKDYIEGKLTSEEINKVTEDVMDRVYYDCNDTGNIFASYTRRFNISTSYTSSSNLGIEAKEFFIPLQNLNLKKSKELEGIISTYGTPYFDSFGHLKKFNSIYTLDNYCGRGESKGFRELINKSVNTKSSIDDILNNFNKTIKESIASECKNSGIFFTRVANSKIEVNVKELYKYISEFENKKPFISIYEYIYEKSNLFTNFIEEILLELVGKNIISETVNLISHSLPGNKDKTRKIKSIKDLEGIYQALFKGYRNTMRNNNYDFKEYELFNNTQKVVTHFITSFNELLTRNISYSEFLTVAYLINDVFEAYISTAHPLVSTKNSKFFSNVIFKNFSKVSDTPKVLEIEENEKIEGLVKLKDYYNNNKDKKLFELSSIGIELIGRWEQLIKNKISYNYNNVINSSAVKNRDSLYFKINYIDDFYYGIQMYLKLNNEYFLLENFTLYSALYMVGKFTDYIRIKEGLKISLTGAYNIFNIGPGYFISTVKNKTEEECTTLKSCENISISTVSDYLTSRLNPDLSKEHLEDINNTILNHLNSNGYKKSKKELINECNIQRNKFEESLANE